jgi:hypothetical protein
MIGDDNGIKVLPPGDGRATPLLPNWRRRPYSSQPAEKQGNNLPCSEPPRNDALYKIGTATEKIACKLLIQKVWLPYVDAFRTCCLHPTPEGRALLVGIRQFGPLLTPTTPPVEGAQPW